MKVWHHDSNYDTITMTVCSEDVHSLRQSQERKGPSKYPRQPSIMHLTFDRPTHHRPNRSRTLSSLLFWAVVLPSKSLSVATFFRIFLSFFFKYILVWYLGLCSGAEGVSYAHGNYLVSITRSHMSGNFGLRPRIKSTRILHQALISPPIPALHVTA